MKLLREKQRYLRMLIPVLKQLPMGTKMSIGKLTVVVHSKTRFTFPGHSEKFHSAEEAAQVIYCEFE